MTVKLLISGLLLTLRSCSASLKSAATSADGRADVILGGAVLEILRRVSTGRCNADYLTRSWLNLVSVAVATQDKEAQLVEDRTALLN